MVDPKAPVLRADDLGLTRGDGCFEATRVVTDESGQHQIDHLDAHLDRFDASCTGLGLPAVDRPAWYELIEQVLGSWRSPGESMLRLMLSRGRESRPGGPVTGLLTVTALTPQMLRQRRDGLAVITLNRGTASDLYIAAPWLLGGLKTLSYAINVAALRVAVQREAEDVIFLSSDGVVLEAPTAAVVWLADGKLNTTAVEGTGVLASITQRALFAAAEKAGIPTGYTLGTAADLRSADGVWLASSGRGVARIHTLDGQPLQAAAGIGDQVAELAGF